MAAWTVQFTNEAVEELGNAISYYNLQNEGLGTEFMLEFEKQIQHLMINPFTRAIRYLTVRFALTDRFPYAIHYTVNETVHIIIIQTVLSKYKNPETNWKER